MNLSKTHALVRDDPSSDLLSDDYRGTNCPIFEISYNHVFLEESTSEEEVDEDAVFSRNVAA